MQTKFENTPRPVDPVIGYVELAQLLKRSAGGLRNTINALPLRRWKVAGVVTWDRAEVIDYMQSR